jgi:LysR family transcriptional regulator, hca operon transcriptional activator
MTPKTSVLSLATSTGGVTRTPLHVKLMLPSSVVIRRLQGAPAIELVSGYSGSNTSTLVKSFLTRIHQLVARLAKPDTDFWICALG